MEITSHFADDLFDGKTVFVTGGSSGINLGIALSFAAVGARVGICGRTQDKLDAAQADLEELGAEVLAAQADVRDYDALDNAFKRTSETLGPIHTLVCGAAGNFIAPSEELSANGFETVVDIDLNGSFNAARAASTSFGRRAAISFSSRPGRHSHRIRRRRTAARPRRAWTT